MKGKSPEGAEDALATQEPSHRPPRWIYWHYLFLHRVQEPTCLGKHPSGQPGKLTGGPGRVWGIQRVILTLR